MGKVQNTKVSKIHSIRFRLIAIVLLPVCFIVFLGVISYRRAAEGFISNYKTSFTSSMEMTSDYVSFIMNTTKGDYNSLVVDSDVIAYASGRFDTLLTQKTTIVHKKQDEFNKSLVAAPFVGNIHLITDLGNSITSENVKEPEMYSAFLETTQGTIAQANSSTYFWFGAMPDLDAKLGVDTSSYAIRMARKFPQGNAFILVDLKHDEILDILQKLEMGENSLVSLILEDGAEITLNSKQEEVNDFRFSEQSFYQDTIASGEEMSLKEVSIEGTSYLFGLKKVGKTNVYISSLVPMANVMEQANDIKTLTVIVVIIASIIASLVGLLIARNMGNTIRQVLKQIKKATEGDMTVTFPTKSKDELGLLCHQLNLMMEHTKLFIEKIKDTANSLTFAANEVSNASNSFVVSAQSIKTATSEIETGIVSQAEDSVKCTEQMDSLSKKIQQVHTNAETIHQIAGETLDSVHTGNDNLNQIQEKTEITTNATDEFIQKVIALEEKTKSIGHIVNVINEISEQTNLLSLNASIEVARAGEAGRGFGVVAQEIRKLSEQTMSSAKKIDDIIIDIIRETDTTAKVAKQAEIYVKEQQEIVLETEKSFDVMNQHVNVLNDQINAILMNLADMEEMRTVTLDSIRDSSAISEETAASSSVLSSNASKQFDIVSNLTSMAETLNGHAYDLEVCTKEFHT